MTIALRIRRETDRPSSQARCDISPAHASALAGRTYYCARAENAKLSWAKRRCLFAWLVREM